MSGNGLFAKGMAGSMTVSHGRDEMLCVRNSQTFGKHPHPLNTISNTPDNFKAALEVYKEQAALLDISNDLFKMLQI